MNDVFFIALRRLRPPLILLILIFAVSTMGLTMIPGVDATGSPWYPSVFQALYFVAYTATTIGFGEIPYAFSDTQRLWVLGVVFSSVLGWAYLLSALLALAQDKGFQQAIVAAQFARGVRRLREPFYVVCGLGETGLMVIRSLDQMGFRFVVVDADPARLNEPELYELEADTLAVAADARLPDTLVQAGVLKPECRGLLVLSNDDEANLAVVLATHLLHPGLRIICRSKSPAITATLQSVTNCIIINPFEEFAERLLLAIEAPESHRLLAWLTDPPGTYLRPRVPSAPGTWVACGHGRFGTQLVAAIERGGFEVVIVDPVGEERPGSRVVRGLGTDRGTLVTAGIETAAGIVAGTDNDTANLAIALTARRLNPDIFIIARQNLVANAPLFAALGANMTMVASEIIANECVATLRTPLLADFLEIVRQRNDAWARGVVERLTRATGEQTPEFWSFTVGLEETPGLVDVMRRGRGPVLLRDLLRSASDRDIAAEATLLLLVRGGRVIELPDEATPVELGDRVLLAGADEARLGQRDVLRNANIADYVLTGRGSLGGWVWQWAAQRREA